MPPAGQAEEVVFEVVLRLVELVLREPDGAAEPGHRLSEARDRVALVPAHELGARDGDRRGDLDLAEERCERPRLWGVVVAEQPEHVTVLDRRAVDPERVLDRGAEGGAAGAARRPWARLGGDRGRAVGGSRIHDEQRVGSPSLGREGGKRSWQVLCAIAHDEHCSDLGLHRVETTSGCWCGRSATPEVVISASLDHRLRLDHRGIAACAASGARARRGPPDAETSRRSRARTQALGLDLARGADPLRVARRAALLGEERFRVRLRAQRIRLPGEGVFVVLDMALLPYPGTPKRTGSTNQSSGTGRAPLMGIVAMSVLPLLRQPDCGTAGRVGQLHCCNSLHVKSADHKWFNRLWEVAQLGVLLSIARRPSR